MAAAVYVWEEGDTAVDGLQVCFQDSMDGYLVDRMASQGVSGIAVLGVDLLAILILLRVEVQLHIAGRIAMTSIKAVLIA